VLDDLGVTDLLPFLVFGVLVAVVYFVLLPRAAKRREARSRALFEVRRLLWGDAPAESATDLLERNRILFIGMELGWEQRLDHRLEDAGGTEIGSSLQKPRPGRLSRNGLPSRLTTVRIEIRDEKDVKQLEIVRPSGIRTQPLEVFDGIGARVGTIARDGRRSRAVLDAAGMRIGTIVRRSCGYAVDYALLDACDVNVGFISDLPHLIERASLPAGDGTAASLRNAVKESQPSEHVLELYEPASREFRSLMLGAAASVFLALQDPFEDGG
jgi:hypothetical protein